MTRFYYRYHGLTVGCDFPIAEWSVFEAAVSTDPDVVVSLTTGPYVDIPGVADSGEYRFFVKEVGWFGVKRGAEIVVAPSTLPITRRLRMFLTGSAWGALLYQRALLPVHASAVETEGGAALFCGRRGQGKSTLAALLSENGFRLISDDLCCVRVMGEGPPVVHPSVPRFKLWADSIHQLGWDRNHGVQDQMRADKFHYVRHSQAELPPMAVKAVYLLNWGEAGFERLTGFSALNGLFNAATWRGDLLISAGNPADFFRQFGEIVRRVPVWEFRRPRDFGHLRSAATLLLTHLTQNRTDSR